MSNSASQHSLQARSHSNAAQPPPQFAVPGTLFPHRLIDQILPTLTGTQWQLLCVIVRQTQGWFDPQTGGRKKSDWLSHSQLRRRTGRGSEALSRAIDALVQKQLIEVRDEAGTLLATAQARQRSYSRLFYSLAPPLLSQFQPDPTPAARPETAPSIADKARNEFRDSGKATPHNKIVASSHSVSPYGKTATTKETLTKERPKKPYRKTAWHKSDTPTQIVSAPWPVASDSVTGPMNKDGGGCFQVTATPVPIAAVSSGLAPDPEVRAFILAYQTAYQKQRGEECPPTHSALNAQEHSLLPIALQRYGLKRLVELLELFFASDLSYIRTHGHGLLVFLSVIHILNALRPQHTVRPQPPQNPKT